MLKASAIGNLGKDAVVRHINGRNVISFSIAHNEKYTDAQGVRHERTTWVDCSFWREGQANVAEYLKRGQLVYVEGLPSAEGYVQKDSGEVRASLRLNVRKLDLLSSGSSGENTAAPAPQAAPAGNQSQLNVPQNAQPQHQGAPAVTAETVDDPSAAW